MDANLIIFQEEKESELTAGLKKQLEEKLKLLKEKNQNLLDLQLKINEQEMKIFDLHIQTEKNKELELRLQKTMKAMRLMKRP